MEERDQKGQEEKNGGVERGPGAKGGRADRIVTIPLAWSIPLAAWSGARQLRPPLTRFANKRYAPGTPAGSWRNQESPV